VNTIEELNDLKKLGENFQIVLKKFLKLDENEISIRISKEKNSALAQINILVKYPTQRGSIIQQIDLDEDEWMEIRDAVDGYIERAEKAIINLKDVFQEEIYFR